jgi:tetratricopeptide (TPR) repeat protein
MKMMFPGSSFDKLPDFLDCGGKRSATPLLETTAQKRRRRFALPAQSKMVPLLLALLFVVSLATTTFAADFATDFSLANKLYAEGKFADAADTYEKILASGKSSPNLFFNYGNAEFKAGNLGKAIAAYRRAELLAPGDSDIRANLDFARKQVQGTTVSESVWRDWLGQLTLNEWAILAAIAFWMTFILFAAKQIRPALAPKLRGATFALISLTILFGAATGLQAAEHFSRQTAVVISNDAVAKSGPFDDAQNAFAVHDGSELSVLDHHDNWIQVADGTGKIGWLQLKQVEVLPGA